MHTARRDDRARIRPLADAAAHSAPLATTCRHRDSRRDRAAGGRDRQPRGVAPSPLPPLAAADSVRAPPSLVPSSLPAGRRSPLLPEHRSATGAARSPRRSLPCPSSPAPLPASLPPLSVPPRSAAPGPPPAPLAPPGPPRPPAPPAAREHGGRPGVGSAAAAATLRCAERGDRGFRACGRRGSEPPAMAEKVSAAPERPGGTGHVNSSCSGSSSGSETLSEEGEPGGGRVAAAPGAGEAAGRLRPGEEQASPGGRPKDDASLEERDEEVRGAGAAALSSPPGGTGLNRELLPGAARPEWEAGASPRRGAASCSPGCSRFASSRLLNTARSCFDSPGSHCY